MGTRHVLGDAHMLHCEKISNEIFGFSLSHTIQSPYLFSPIYISTYAWIWSPCIMHTLWRVIKLVPIILASIDHVWESKVAFGDFSAILQLWTRCGLVTQHGVVYQIWHWIKLRIAAWRYPAIIWTYIDLHDKSYPCQTSTKPLQRRIWRIF